jgi:hypothetical protein
VINILSAIKVVGVDVEPEAADSPFFLFNPSKEVFCSTAILVSSEAEEQEKWGESTQRADGYANLNWSTGINSQ